MTERCTRWMDLSDRQFLGEELGESELDFVRAHELECTECSREAAVLRELRPPPLHVVPSEDEVRRILLQAELSPLDEAHHAPSPPGGWSRQPRRVVAAGVALLAVAASLALWVRQPSSRQASPTRSALPAMPASRAVGALPKVLASQATEGSCGLLVEGIVLCLAPGSEVGRVELEGPRRLVELKHGRALASLEPQPKGSSFSIVTERGEVRAVGTIFSVEFAEDGDTYARVTRGKVAVRMANAPAEQLLLAGQQLRLGDPAASALSLSEAERDLELVAQWLPSMELGGPHVEPSAAEREAAKPTEGTGVDPGSPSAIRDDLGRARRLRAQGFFTRAAEIYKSVHARSPRSESGRAALMSLAGLQLSTLGDPNGALASYQLYLAGGNGPLRQQAEYGKIRALRRLGRATEEIDAIRRFIVSYPNAPEARLLKERISGSSRP